MQLLAGTARWTHVDAVAVHGFPLDWNLWQIHEWPAKIDEIRAVTDKPVWVSEVGVSTFGAEEVQDWGFGRTAELLHRAGAAHPLVQPLRPAARLGGDDPPQGGGGLVLLPAFPHGPAARGRHAEARRRDASANCTPDLGICQWFHFEDHRLDDAVRLAEALGVTLSAHRPDLGRLLPARRAALVRPADGGAGETST